MRPDYRLLAVRRDVPGEDSARDFIRYQVEQVLGTRSSAVEGNDPDITTALWLSIRAQAIIDDIDKWGASGVVVLLNTPEGLLRWSGLRRL